jgi:hypothetical protein
MRGLHSDHSAQVTIAGHAFMQNLRRGHYELATDAAVAERVASIHLDPVRPQILA